MERVLCIPLSTIVERKRLNDRWQSDKWSATAVLLGQFQRPAGSLLLQAGEISSYFAGVAVLELHPTELASYCENVAQRTPCVYVVLAKSADAVPHVHIVTASPDEAWSYQEAEPELVDSVPMPAPLLGLVRAYIDANSTGVRPDGETVRPHAMAREGSHERQ